MQSINRGNWYTATKDIEVQPINREGEMRCIKEGQAFWVKYAKDANCIDILYGILHFDDGTVCKICNSNLKQYFRVGN